MPSRPLAVRAAWAVLLLVMPLTSFPLAARLIGSTMVAPASALVLAVVVLVWFLPYLIRRGTLPPQSVPLIGLFGVALASTLLAYLAPIPMFREVPQWRTNLEALVTLALGVTFFLVAATLPRSQGDLAFSLRWLNWGGFLLVVWSLLQGYYWHTLHDYPAWMFTVQAWLSSSILFPERITGLAFEPSWLAHQLNMAYLPFWLAATVRGTTVHRRLWKISFENLLLLGGLGVLVLTVSRVGVLAFLLMGALLVVLLSLWVLNWAEERWLKGRQGRRRLRLLMAASMMLLYLAVLLGVGFAFSRYDPRMARIFDVSVLRTQGIVYYANQLVFAERVVFWDAGYAVFNDHPVMGVGLGNAGYYFPAKLGAFSWNLTEVRRAMYEWMTLPNIKSLWVRLLAETGVVGFAFFVGWWYLLWQSARFLWSARRGLPGALGLGGAFVLVGLLAEGFSVDTFALPYFWVSLGLVTAASEVERGVPERMEIRR